MSGTLTGTATKFVDNVEELEGRAPEDMEVLDRQIESVLPKPRWLFIVHR